MVQGSFQSIRQKCAFTFSAFSVENQRCVHLSWVTAEANRSTWLLLWTLLDSDSLLLPCPFPAGIVLLDPLTLRQSWMPFNLLQV